MLIQKHTKKRIEITAKTSDLVKLIMKIHSQIFAATYFISQWMAFVRIIYLLYNYTKKMLKTV